MRYLNFSMVGFVILTLGKLLGRKLLRIRGSIILSVGSGFILNYQTTSKFELSSCIDVEQCTTWICKAKQSPGAVVMSLGFCIPLSFLGKSGLLCGDVAPLLDDGLLDLPGVGPGPGADLLGHVDALLGGLQLGHQLGHVLASPLGLEGALLLGGVLDDSLHLVEALLGSLLEATASRGTELPGLLGAAGDRGVLLHRLLGDRAHLLGPLGALGVGGVAAGVVLALLFDLGLAGDHIVLHVVHLLLGPALGLVLGPADLRALHVTVLHQGGPADGGGLVEGDLLVLDETVLPEVLLAVLLLLGLVVGG